MRSSSLAQRRKYRVHFCYHHHDASQSAPWSNHSAGNLLNRIRFLYIIQKPSNHCQAPLILTRSQSEVLVRVRPKRIQHKFLKHIKRGEFLAWSPGSWTIGAKTAASCRHDFTVLATSAGARPEVVEIGNCLATRSRGVSGSRS